MSQDMPAYPHWDGPSGHCYSGMTLMDHFAAQAMASLIVKASADYIHSHTERSVIAYAAAHAMIVERAKWMGPKVPISKHPADQTEFTEPPHGEDFR